MSEALDLQVYSLLGRLQEMRDASCRQLQETASAQAREILAAARQRARQRVKEAVIEKRRQVEERCRRARVEIEARRRTESFAGFGQRLEEGLAALPGALAARWAEPAARRSWCRLVLDGAAAVLAPGRWTLLAAPGLGADEKRELAARAGELAGEEARIEERADLSAGLAVVQDGARYDGTTQGLLADSDAVRAALLAEFASPGPAS